MNPTSISAMLSLGSILQDRSQYLQAAELYNRAINCIESLGQGGSTASKGEVWAALGFCALMLDDLPKAYSAYQQALLNLGTVLDPMIWYGIGILYDRYGSDEHALEAYGLAVKLLSNRMSTTSSYKLVRDIYYRMAVLFRCRQKWDSAIKCFEFVLSEPPAGFSPEDIKMQIALVESAKGTNESMVVAKETLLGLIASAAATNRPQRLALAQCHLAWMNAASGEESASLSILTQTAAVDTSNPLPHYYLGRLYSRLAQPVKAYESFQQAVYRDGRNAAFWNSVGILYMESSQFKDALDAFSRAIQLAPYKSDCWWNVGCLYEISGGQLTDAADAYQRALELEPEREKYVARLRLVRAAIANKTAIGGDRPELVELDPLLFLPRPTLLNGTTLPVQSPISQLPPPPVINRPPPSTVQPQSHGSHGLPRLPTVKMR